MCCYLLNPFQNKVFILFHNISHQFTVSQSYFKVEHHSNHDFLKSTPSEYKHGHSHNELHSHKTLSYVRAIFNFKTLENSYTKNKITNKIDKHIITEYLVGSMEYLNVIKHVFLFNVSIVKSPYLKITDPPPRLIIAKKHIVFI